MTALPPLAPITCVIAAAFYDFYLRIDTAYNRPFTTCWHVKQSSHQAPSAPLFLLSKSNERLQVIPRVDSHRWLVLRCRRRFYQDVESDWH